MFREKQPSGNASPAEIALVKAVNVFEKQRRFEDYRAVMATAEGRRVVWDFLAMLQLFNVKEYTTRSVGLPFLDYLCDNFGDEYLTAQREQMNANKAFISQVRKIREGQEKHSADSRGARQA